VISQKKLLEIVYEAAQCFIPTERLTSEQLGKLDNISSHLCNCRQCRKALTSSEPWKALGHANKKTYSIGISRDGIKLMAGIEKRKPFSVTPIFLLDLLYTILHEVVHILFPEYSEEEASNKAYKWLNSFRWKEAIESESSKKRG